MRLYNVFMLEQNADGMPLASQLHVATDLNDAQNPALLVGSESGQLETVAAKDKLLAKHKNRNINFFIIRDP